MIIFSAMSPTDKIKDPLDTAYSMGKEAMKHFISCRVVTLEKYIYCSIKKLKLGTSSNMTKRVTVKLRGRDVQFLGQSEIFGKIALISQSSFKFERNIQVLSWVNFLCSS